MLFRSSAGDTSRANSTRKTSLTLRRDRLMRMHRYTTTEASRALFDGLARYPALERLVRGTHRIVVWSMARSADGRLLATLDMTGGAWLWDAASLRPLAQLVPPSEKDGIEAINLGSVAFSPAGDAEQCHLQHYL